VALSKNGVASRETSRYFKMLTRHNSIMIILPPLFNEGVHRAGKYYKSLMLVDCCSYVRVLGKEAI
jgi:hypothetical protein